MNSLAEMLIVLLTIVVDKNVKINLHSVLGKLTKN